MTSSEPSLNRPFVVLSAAISLDGQIASKGGDSRLSNTRDWRRVHYLRAESDAIMVGSGTIRSDDSKLTIKEELIETSITRHPIRVVASSKGLIPLNAKVITHRPDIPTLIATTTQCSSKQRKSLEEKGCRIIECGNGPLTDLPQLLHILKRDYNVNKLLLEGGSQMNGKMLQCNLIDEVQLTIAPVICGNEGVPLFSLPQSISTFTESPFFEVTSYDKIDDMIWLRLSVHYHSRQII